MNLGTKWTKGLRGKLLLLGAFPTLAIALIVFYSLNTAQNLEGRIRYAYEVRVRLIDQVGIMSGSVHALGRWMWIVNGFAGNEQKQATFMDRAKKEIEKFEATKKSYSELPCSEEIIKIFASIEASWVKAKDATERALAEYNKHTQEGNEAGKKILSTDFVQNLVPITTAFQEIDAKMQTILTTEIAETTAQVNRDKIRLWIVGFSVTLATLGLAIMLSLKLAHSFSAIGHGIGSASKDTASASEQLSSASQSLSGGASTAAASLEETVSSLEELTSMVKRNADNAKEAGILSNKSREAAEVGQKEISAMVTAIADLAQSSKKIEEITSVIDDIAFQTNLLALNAAVEAARAGEQGKGFAIVADAVRSLAQRSATAAKDISGLIKENVSKTSHSVSMAEKNGSVLKGIVDEVKKVTGLNQEIAHASQEQSVGLSQISVAMNLLDKSIQENAASSEEVAASSEEMSAQAMQLFNMAEALNLLIDGGSPNNFEYHHQKQSLRTRSVA